MHLLRKNKDFLCSNFLSATTILDLSFPVLLIVSGDFEECLRIFGLWNDLIGLLSRVARKVESIASLTWHMTPGIANPNQYFRCSVVVPQSLRSHAFPPFLHLPSMRSSKDIPEPWEWCGAESKGYGLPSLGTDGFIPGLRLKLGAGSLSARYVSSLY